jgi:hypothetical protein
MVNDEIANTIETPPTEPFFIFFKLIGSGFGQKAFAGFNRHCGFRICDDTVVYSILVPVERKKINYQPIF